MRLPTVMRIVFYLVITLLLLLLARSESDTISGLITGILVADYLTWFFFTIPTIWERVEEGAWEALVNLVAGVTIFHFCRIDVPRTDDGLAVAFLAFLAVFGVKATCNGLKLVMSDVSADE